MAVAIVLMVLLGSPVLSEYIPITVEPNLTDLNEYIAYLRQEHYCDLPVYPGYPIRSTHNTSLTTFSLSTSRESLLSNYSNLTISLSTATSYTTQTIDTLLSDYLNELSLQNDYLFGNHYQSEWNDLLSDYQLPEEAKNTRNSLAFGIAGKYSGVPYHYHGDGYAEVLHGGKLWLLYPPDSEFEFDPNQSMLDYMMNVFPGVSRSKMKTGYPYLCVLESDDLLYFPDRWMHAVFNLDEYNAFISIFL